MSQDATLISGGGAVAALPPQIFNLTAGMISGPGTAPFSVPGADALIPSGLTYHLSVTGPSGELVLEKDVSITGTTVDLGTLASVFPAGQVLPGLGGDVTGPASATRVVGLQGRSLVSTAPTSGQVIGYNGTVWAPTSTPTLPGFVRADGTTPLTANWNAGLFQIQSRNSVDVFNVKAYGALVDGITDDTVAVQAAINAASVKGGRVAFPVGSCTCAGNLTGANGVHFIGEGGRTSGSKLASQLVFTGVGAGDFLTLNGTSGGRLTDLFIGYNNAGFTGTLVNADDTGGGVSYLSIDHCLIGGLGVANASTVLLSLDNVIIADVRSTNFSLGGIGIRGIRVAGHLSQVVGITDCTFLNLSTANIKNPSESWSIVGNTFENLVSGTRLDVTHDAGILAKGLYVAGNWSGDGNATGDAYRVAGSGLTFHGNAIQTATNGIIIDEASSGVSIEGNNFNALTNGVNLNSLAHIGVSIFGNDLNAVTNKLVNSGSATNMVALGNKPDLGVLLPPAAAGTLTGATLAAGVTASSLTSVGTLTGLAVHVPGGTEVADFATSSSGTSFISQQFTNTGGTLRLGLDSSAGGGLTVGGLPYAGLLNTTGATALQLGTGNNVRVTIDPGGNVGIGMSVPTSPLQVVTLPTFATNALAIAGGLTAGAFFKVNVAGEYQVHVVV